jgi:TrmH family RNA methyltransferase
MIITSKDNETIKSIKKLKEKKYRTESFIVEGIKMVKEALEQAEVEKVIVSETFSNSDDFKGLNCDDQKLIIASDKVFEDLTDVVTPQGIIAVVKKSSNLEIDYSDEFVLALDGIQDPGNLGTIIRTADSANIKQILVSKDTVDAYSPKVVRSTMGGIFRTKVIEVEDLAQVLNAFKNNGYKVVTTELSAEKSIYDIDYQKSVVVIGNEANGVTEEVSKTATEKVIIPMLGKTESLNAAVATSIMIYEYVRKKLGK